jgi:hypothetical protein
LERGEREAIMKPRPLQKQDPGHRIAPDTAQIYFVRQI